jgi:hypothetical protein
VPIGGVGVGEVEHPFPTDDEIAMLLMIAA